MPGPNYPSTNIFLGLPDIMNGIRLCPANSFWTLVDASGNTYNLKDLGLEVIGYTGGGMAPIVNQTTPYALIGGSYYQRTVPGPRTLTLMCYIQGANLRGLQILRKALISYVAPDTLTQQAAQIKLRYALTDYCGAVIGTVLEMACNYVSGLEGNVDNLNQERFPLQFIEYAPPSIKELPGPYTPPLTTQVNFALASQWFTRDNNFVWHNYNITTANIQSMSFDSSDSLLFIGMTNAIKQVVVTTGTISTTTATNGAVNALLKGHRPTEQMYAGGAFTAGNPGAFIVGWTGAAWFTVGATINNTVRGLAADNAGLIYAVGDFTAPNNRAAYWDGANWTQLTAGANLNNTARCIVLGLDGNMYIGGDFTTADGTTVNRVVGYNTSTGAYFALGSGMNGAVNALAVGNDGRLYAGGAFTTAGGVTCNRVAVWNGTQWQPLGTGFNSSVNALYFYNGRLYAGGAFTNLGTATYAITPGLAVWGGSAWYPDELSLTLSGNNVTCFAARGLPGTTNYSFNVGSTGVTAALAAGETTLVINGTAPVRPTISFSGVGRIYLLVNYLTGKYVYFNYSLQSGETLALNLQDNTCISSFYGNVIGKLIFPSDLTTWAFLPGTTGNYIGVLATGTVTASTSYYATHWSFDAGVS